MARMEPSNESSTTTLPAGAFKGWRPSFFSLVKMYPTWPCDAANPWRKDDSAQACTLGSMVSLMSTPAVGGASTRVSKTRSRRSTVNSVTPGMPRSTHSKPRSTPDLPSLSPVR